ncbi:unnamed protein product [Clonostachys rosea f. rosea IK726]|uniref:Uncharacterized protein n=1 Tax=Clonostachys rosea f. rosea IK726 TaxID=1349383 RepID=A0ACA9UKF6_BIOOC|nr:unnamed protein product [Clonostachys rosea f. rosea IK726]
MSFLYDTQGFIHRREEAIPTADQAGYPPGVPFTPSSYHDVGVVIGASNGSGEGSGSVSYESFIIWAERVPCLTSWSRQVRASLSSPSEEVAEAPVYPVVAEPDVPVKTPLGDLWPQTTNEGGIFYRGALVGADTELPQPDQTLNRGPMRYKYCISSDAYQRVYTESPPRSRVEEEGAVILQIWAYAVQEKPELIGNLSDMLMSLPDPDISYYQDVRLVRGDYCADVNTAEAHIDRATATLLQKHLLKKGNVWYYTAPEVAKDEETFHLIGQLGREGCRLPVPYWSILAKYGLIRSAEIEVMKRYGNPSGTDNRFGHDLKRLLKEFVESSIDLRHIKLQFTAREGSSFTTAYIPSERKFRINSKYLDADTWMDASDDEQSTLRLPSESLHFRAAGDLYCTLCRDVWGGQLAIQEEDLDSEDGMPSSGTPDLGIPSGLTMMITRMAARVNGRGHA